MSEQNYDEFIDKFKTKRTTDDCYTPEAIYKVVAEYVEKRYGVSRENYVRPFYPGGDYEHFDYKPGCIVVDNPPFSRLSEICSFYSIRKIPCFLFAPSLTVLTSIRRAPGMCAVICGYNVTYDNGAKIETSFITNLEAGLVVRTAPDLYEAIKAADEMNQRKDVTGKIKYSYPPEVLTVTTVRDMAKNGIEYELKAADAKSILDLDAQRKLGKGVFGTGFLLSENAAREKTQAEEQLTLAKAQRKRDAMTEWKLSDREREIVRCLGKSEV